MQFITFVILLICSQSDHNHNFLLVNIFLFFLFQIYIIWDRKQGVRKRIWFQFIVVLIRLCEKTSRNSMLNFTCHVDAVY